MSNFKVTFQTTGEEDKYLTHNPESTHFKRNHKRHTHFGVDWICISNNNKNISNYCLPNSSYYFRIEADGDLINNLYLKLKLKKNVEWTKNKFGIYETVFKIIKNIQFLTDDKILSDMSSDFIFSYFELNYNKSEKKALVNMISYDKASYNNQDEYVYLYLPLPLWFHKNNGHAFPLWALNKSNVGIKLNTNNYDSTNREIADIQLLVDFGFLNIEEKEQFTNKSLEYLIEMPELLENVEIQSNSKTIKTNLVKTHFIRYILWNIKDNTNQDNFKFRDDLENADILINGNALTSYIDGSFYNFVSRYMHFNSSGTLFLGDSNGNYDGDSLNNVYTYSFCLEPLSIKPSGYLTSEKFNNVGLTLRIKESPGINRKVSIYIVKHNILRIENGILNLAYN